MQTYMNTQIDIAQYIDHTLLKSDSLVADVNTLCQEAITHNFYAVCINSCHTQLAHTLLEAHPTKIAVTVGFPLGAMHSSAKAAEAYQAVIDGADEIDMVMNIGFLKSGLYDEVVADMKAVKDATKQAVEKQCSNTAASSDTHNRNIVVKVIFENCLLTKEEKYKACTLAKLTGIDFIKTSTGFTTGATPSEGATKEDLILMLAETQGTPIKVKAAGGVKDYQTAVHYINMGVSRIGTSSGIAIINGNTNSHGY